MARMVVINVTCDKCGTTVVEEDSKAVEIQIGEEKVVIDLDPKCVKLLTAGYTSKGRPVELAGPKQERKVARFLDDDGNEVERACAAIGCPKSFNSRQGYANHLSRTHGITDRPTADALIDGTMAWGDPTPAPKDTSHHGEFPCDQCDFVAKAISGLGSHKRSAHGIVGTSTTATKEAARKARGGSLPTGRPKSGSKKLVAVS